jgi:hypothetical protein
VQPFTKCCKKINQVQDALGKLAALRNVRMKGTIWENVRLHIDRNRVAALYVES